MFKYLLTLQLLSVFPLYASTNSDYHIVLSPLYQSSKNEASSSERSNEVVSQNIECTLSISLSDSLEETSQTNDGKQEKESEENTTTQKNQQLGLVVTSPVNKVELPRQPILVLDEPSPFANTSSQTQEESDESASGCCKSITLLSVYGLLMYVAIKSLT